MIKMFKKLISVAVILLFIGLAFAPSINADVGKEELVEFTTELCGLNGSKQTVKLTQQQADEVEALFNSIREQLNATESREEAEDIFKDAVMELDKYGLLGGLSIKQAQRLVVGDYLNQKSKQYFKDIKSTNLADKNDSNYLCLILGSSDLTSIIGPFTFLSLLYFAFLWSKYMVISTLIMYILLFLCMTFGKIEFFESIANFILNNLGNLLVIKGKLLLYLTILVHFIPIKFGSIVTFGFPNIAYPYGDDSPAEGEIFTFGLNGKKIWSGKFFGGMGPYVGVIGFSGLKITKNLLNNLYLGFACKIKINMET